MFHVYLQGCTSFQTGKLLSEGFLLRVPGPPRKKPNMAGPKKLIVDGRCVSFLKGLIFRFHVGVWGCIYLQFLGANVFIKDSF